VVDGRNQISSMGKRIQYQGVGWRHGSSGSNQKTLSSNTST
jgi:hypothetical protein